MSQRWLNVSVEFCKKTARVIFGKLKVSKSDFSHAVNKSVRKRTVGCCLCYRVLYTHNSIRETMSTNNNMHTSYKTHKSDTHSRLLLFMNLPYFLSSVTLLSFPLLGDCTLITYTAIITTHALALSSGWVRRGSEGGESTMEACRPRCKLLLRVGVTPGTGSAPNDFECSSTWPFRTGDDWGTVAMEAARSNFFLRPGGTGKSPLQWWVCFLKIQLLLTAGMLLVNPVVCTMVYIC